MARGINKVILIGNLGRDPDVRYTPSGSAVTNLALATDDSYKDKNTGQMVDKTEWHRIVMFGKIAEIAGQYLAKGSKIYLEGKLQTRKWTNKEGQDVYTTEIVVDITGTMQMLDSKPQDGAQQSHQQPNNPQGGQGQQHQQRSPQGQPQGGQQQPRQNTQQQPQGGNQPDPIDDFDDDIPF